MALACMEKEGVVMSAEVVNATNEYCNDFQMLIPPSVMERAMDDLNRRHHVELALKDERIDQVASERDAALKRIQELEAQLAAKDADAGQ